MYIKQLYTNCLAEAAYYIESEGEAAVIDPLRETFPYIKLAESRNSNIKYIFETHFHADFISGHIDLSNATGAEIIYGPDAKANYKITVAKDEQEFQLGKIKIKVLHTPGHTLESSCFLLIDENGKEQAVFTGDTLFIGDVGRPDLAVKSNLSKEDLAAMLYNSINDKLLKLSDEVVVYPGHGAGSQCGKNLSIETVSTIGAQKKYNYALQNLDKEEFVKAVTEGIQPPPQYFPKNAVINKTGYDSIENVIQRNYKPLYIKIFKDEINKGALILDTRSFNDFCEGHVPNSLNVSLDGSFAVWVGTLIEELDTPLILVCDKQKEEESIIRLARVGYENVNGFLLDGFDTWKSYDETIGIIDNINAEVLGCLETEKAGQIIDVRNPLEFLDGTVKGAENIPLANLTSSINELDKSKTYYLLCKTGYRSVIAASILKRNGFEKIYNIRGGLEAFQKQELEYQE